jgi:predicted enzyme related to lactoylglutathione lyase
MADPVVHFEIIGTHPERLREYYSALFGWSFATPSPVADTVSDADEYGFLDLVQADDGSGIRGGVGGGAGFTHHAVLYVGVADVEAALRRAEELGGTRIMGPATSPNGLVVAHFSDPEGTVLGLAGTT